MHGRPIFFVLPGTITLIYDLWFMQLTKWMTPIRFDTNIQESESDNDGTNDSESDDDMMSSTG